MAKVDIYHPDYYRLTFPKQYAKFMKTNKVFRESELARRKELNLGPVVRMSREVSRAERKGMSVSGYKKHLKKRKTKSWEHRVASARKYVTAAKKHIATKRKIRAIDEKIAKLQLLKKKLAKHKKSR
jgi:hypothetical protein